MKFKELESHFQTFGYKQPVEIMPGVTITDAERFVTSTLIILRAHSGDKNYLPYYDMLMKYYNQVKWG